LLTTTTAVCVLLAWPHHSHAFERGPRAVIDNNIDPHKFSEANGAAEVNQVVPQSNVPGFGNQAGDQHGPNMDIPGINLSNTPGTGTPLNGPKGVPGIDTVNGGAANLNLPGSSFQHSPDDIDKVIGKMGQEAQGIVDKAAQGGPNSLNIPTSSSAPGVRESDGDGVFSTVWNAVTSFFAGLFSDPKGDPQSANTNAKGTSSSELHPNPYGPNESSANTTPAGKGTSASELHPNPYGPDDPSANTKSASKDPGLHPNPYKDPNPEDSGSASGTGGLSAESPLAKKGQGGGTGNNPEESSGATGGLASTSSYARRNHGDGGDDPGDNNNHAKAGGLASGTPFARRGNGDGGGSDNRGSSSGNAKATGKPRGPGGNNQLGNADSKVVSKSRVIGAGLLESDSGFTAQGPSAAGTVARAPGGTAAIAGRINSR
jgi:hypothetical protein